jgi:predicted RNase H-like HicB family nuclease
MASYIALLRKEARSDYGVDFPDFPGCVSAGRTLDEARRMAGEALALHIHGMLEDGAAMPAPSSLETVMEDPHNRDAVGFLVDVPTQAARTVRVNVPLPEELVAAIDRVTTNRSRFLSEAAREKLRVG